MYVCDVWCVCAVCAVCDWCISGEGAVCECVCVVCVKDGQGTVSTLCGQTHSITPLSLSGTLNNT